MHFSERMLEAAEVVMGVGHIPIISSFVESFIGKNDTEKEEIKISQKMHEDAQKKDWEKLKEADALLVINLERHGIPNYIGGNTLFEIAAGYFSDKKIFLLNPIPDIPYYKTELEAVRPTILYGDVSQIH